MNTIEDLNEKDLLNLIYGISVRLFYGMSNDNAKKQAKKTLLKAKTICKEKKYDYSEYEMLQVEDIINEKTYKSLLKAYYSDSKKEEKELFINFNNKTKVFVEEQDWLGYRVEVFPEEYTNHSIDDKEGIKTLAITIGAKVKNKVSEKFPDLDKYNKNNCLHKISNLLENFALENNISLFVSVDDIDYLYYTD